MNEWTTPGIFYFTLGNRAPKQRSKLKSIHLLCILKHKYLCYYGIDKVMMPFIEDLKKLVSKNNYYNTISIHIDLVLKQELGTTIIVRGTHQTVFGSLAGVSADNLASLSLGGFKESCTAHRMCRHCMATLDRAKTKVHL